MAADSERLAEVRGWLTRADADLRAADHDRRADPPLLGDAVFHAQQAVEKCLKAFLTSQDRRFRKTHDLVELGRSCAEVDDSLESLLRRVAPLTEYAWRFRYPGEPEAPTLEEANGAFQLLGSARSSSRGRARCSSGRTTPIGPGSRVPFWKRSSTRSSSWKWPSVTRCFRRLRSRFPADTRHSCTCTDCADGSGAPWAP